MSDVPQSTQPQTVWAGGWSRTSARFPWHTGQEGITPPRSGASRGVLIGRERSTDTTVPRLPSD